MKEVAQLRSPSSCLDFRPEIRPKTWAKIRHCGILASVLHRVVAHIDGTQGSHPTLASHEPAPVLLDADPEGGRQTQTRDRDSRMHEGDSSRRVAACQPNAASQPELWTCPELKGTESESE